MARSRSPFVHRLTLLLGLFAAGCGEGETSTGGTTTGATTSTPTFEYPMDDVLRMNHLQAKGTHNSYHVALDPDVLPELLYTHAPLDVQLSEQGVRKFELDVHLDAETGQFAVLHEFFDKGTTCPTLRECLSVVKAWSDENPAHHPLFVQIEPKSVIYEEDAEDRIAALEADVLAVFPRGRIVTPDDVRGGAASVREAITTKGWPTLGQARGKIAFFIDDTSDWQGYYTHGKKDLEGRLMFVDGEPSDPFAGILVFNDPTGEAALIEESLSLGLIVRVRADSGNTEPFAGDTSRRDAAFASGAQLVSTDYPAPVEGVDYVVEVPGGTPSRCNPVTAPEGCTSESIEDPEYVK